jgi:hypothetical protein
MQVRRISTSAIRGAIRMGSLSIEDADPAGDALSHTGRPEGYRRLEP